ncbi:MAG: hypothetical protein PWQ57_2438 [Desulfovibrionales bacterium]|jgi:hypothetical protein|nr:hypothetical protein [Desulfovibrionales bacterium]
MGFRAAPGIELSVMGAENTAGAVPAYSTPMGSLQALILMLSGAGALAALHADPAIRSRLRIEDVAHIILELHPQRDCPLCGQTRVNRGRPCPCCHGLQRRFFNPKQRLHRCQTMLIAGLGYFYRLSRRVSKPLSADLPQENNVADDNHL